MKLAIAFVILIYNSFKYMFHFNVNTHTGGYFGLPAEPFLTTYDISNAKLMRIKKCYRVGLD